MAAKTSWHRYGTKLRHCHPMYRPTIGDQATWNSRRVVQRTTTNNVHCSCKSWHVRNQSPTATASGNIATQLKQRRKVYAQTPLPRFVVQRTDATQWLSTRWNTHQMYSRTTLGQEYQVFRHCASGKHQFACWLAILKENSMHRATLLLPSVKMQTNLWNCLLSNRCA